MNIATSEQTRFQIRRKLLSLRETFYISDMTGGVHVTATLKSFRLGYHLRVYSGLHEGTEILTIRPLTTFSPSATYEILDALSGSVVGMLKQNIGQVIWIIMDANGREIGTVAEIRPSRHAFTGTVNGELAFGLSPRHHFLTMHMDLDFPAGSERVLDQRVGFAVGLLQTIAERSDGD